jgi:hypothetical protein
MDTENTDSNYDLIVETEKRKASSLRSLSTLEIEKAIATTLTKLLGWNHDVKICNLNFNKINNDVEISLEVVQSLFQKTE